MDSMQTGIQQHCEQILYRHVCALLIKSNRYNQTRLDSNEGVEPG